ncbi:uncharacterized protein LOC132405180 [Hypanus sabinus]|uniref:uncharacterized protein LOC132405180 n=1 Tax=Hypanus sabinus TaxID=79690 RepID=UPI0028C4E280|nr:uncharacterized protein LOC132405180 [Hypanus sabinus]
MRLQIGCCKMCSLLIFSLFVSLLQSDFTQRSIILAQREPSYEILKQYQNFEIKVVAKPGKPKKGSDITLSCIIPRLPDTVSLRWKPRDSSQQNRRNTDQIRLNNTVYLIIRHVTVEDEKMYECEVRVNGTIVRTRKSDFTVNTGPYREPTSLYRSVTDHSEFHLNCYNSNEVYNNAIWSWTSIFNQSLKKQIATALKSQPVNDVDSHFVNRLKLTATPFNGWNFSMRVFPVVFEDAGEYTCTLDQKSFQTMKLVTVKVTAELSDTVTEGDTVTLSCSVSFATASTRLVWINGDGETVGDKTLSDVEKSLSLIIQKADRGRGKWTCVVFDQDRLRLSLPYSLEVKGNNYTNNIAIIGSLVLLLIIILGLVLCLKKCKRKDQPPVTETSHAAEYMSVDNKSKQEDTEEAIHYGDIDFKNETSGSRHDMQGKSTINVGDSKDGKHSVYAEIAQVT